MSTDTQTAAPRTTTMPSPTPGSPEARAAAALAARREDAASQGASETAVADQPAGQQTAAPEPASGSAEGPRRRADRPAGPAAVLVPVPRVIQDVVLFLGRLVLGVVLIAHGLQKLTQGAGATAEGFGQMGIPQPEAAAIFAMVAEIGGGALLILGLLTPLAALLPAMVMAGAVALHAGSGIFVTDGGWEFAATLGVAALVLAVVGPGRFSVDARIARALRR